MYNEGALTLNSSTISGNVGIVGGGIDNINGTLTLTNSAVNGNKGSSHGGGIANCGTVTLTNSTVSGNVAHNGGGICNYIGTVMLINSTISDNRAYQYGGGIFISTMSTVILTNSTVSGNSVTHGSGGGIYNGSDLNTLILTNSTVSGNSAYYDGGGINNSGKLTLANSIVSGNNAVTGNELYHYIGGTGTITADSYNLFGHSGETNAQAFDGFTPGATDLTATSDGTTPTALAAILSPLTNNGGPTQTHALPEDSPAIDLDAACSTGLITDQRGEHRPVGAGCDAGSFESNSCASAIIVDAGGICTFANAITAANTDAPSGGCPAGCGDDTIILETNVALTAALPQITTTITIEGQGHTIDGQKNSAVGSCAICRQQRQPEPARNHHHGRQKGLFWRRDLQPWRHDHTEQLHGQRQLGFPRLRWRRDLQR